MRSALIPGVFLLLLSSVLAGQNYKINTQNHLFLDQYNRTVIFHGVNAVYKLNPSYPPILDKFDHKNSLAPQDFENLRSWGLNVVRLYVAWEATEPVRGQYNTTYLEVLKSIIKTAAKYNVTIILDAHQDVVSRKLCGEGFPDWAVNRTDFPKPVDAHISFDSQGHAKIEDCVKIDFRKYYKSNDVRKAFKAFYLNTDGIQDAFANFWRTVANFFKDEPNVLAYELLNEPEAFDDSLITNYDMKYLQPMYQKIHKKIREVDDKTIIFFENSHSDKTVIGFTETPGGAAYNDRQAFAYHIYCPLVDSSGEPVNPSLCQTSDSLDAKLKSTAASKLGIGAFMTEFGAVGNGTKSVGEINTVTGIADTYFHSWAYWQFKYYDDFTTLDKPGSIESFYNENGSLQQGKVKALARTYVYATCGEPLSQSFDPSVGRYLYVFKASKNCKGLNTELFASQEFYYPHGIEYKFVNCDKCTVAPLNGQKSYYQVILSDAVQEGDRITLDIVPADKKFLIV